MDADALYRQGVIAIRDQNDLKRGHDLLVQSLQQNPNNDMAWLWLARTVRNPQTRLHYVERALHINPANEPAQKLKARLLSESAVQTPPPPPVIAPLPVVPPFVTTEIPEEPAESDSAQSEEMADDLMVSVSDSVQSDARELVQITTPPTVAVPATKAEKDRIAQLMDRANTYLEAGETEAAIEQWIEVLSIRVDYEVALRNAAGHLWQLHYQDDARELIGRAIVSGTKIPTIYMTAIDMAERQGDYAEAEALRERIASLPDADEQLLVTVVDYYAERLQFEQARQFVERALETNPKRQKLLVRMGELLENMELPQTAITYYDQAVRLGTRTDEGKAADKRLARAVPVITDHERGNIWLAVRETVGFVVFWLIMAWQDAGLNLIDMGLRHWVGIVLSFVGGYLLVTATSSPQQDPIASWLGGDVPAKQPYTPDERFTRPGQAKPDPTELPIISDDARTLLGLVGVLVLALAFALVFHRSLSLVIDHPPPYLPWSNLR